MKNIINILFVAILFTSCEKIVDIEYNNNQSKIIIEGNITNEPGPYFVKITKSISLSSTNSYPTVDNAIVIVSDDAGSSETLIPRGKGVYSTSTLTGVIGRTYTLTVKADNQTYTAQSTMQQQVPFDSIKIVTDIVTGEKEYSLIPVYTDPLVEGNNYRFVFWLNNTLIGQHLIQNDKVKNGTVNTTRLEIDDSNFKFKSGDSVTIQMQCIDENVAIYYTSLALMSDSGPGGGTAPSNPPNNISNNGLGVFSAHTVETAKKILP